MSRKSHLKRKSLRRGNAQKDPFRRIAKARQRPDKTKVKVESRRLSTQRQNLQSTLHQMFRCHLCRSKSANPKSPHRPNHAEKRLHLCGSPLPSLITPSTNAGHHQQTKAAQIDHVQTHNQDITTVLRLRLLSSTLSRGSMFARQKSGADWRCDSEEYGHSTLKSHLSLRLKSNVCKWSDNELRRIKP